MIVSLWRKVVVCLCLFNLQRNKKWRLRGCCGVWCLGVLEAPWNCLSECTLCLCVCVFVVHRWFCHRRAQDGTTSGKLPGDLSRLEQRHGGDLSRQTLLDQLQLNMDKACLFLHLMSGSDAHLTSLCIALPSSGSSILMCLKSSLTSSSSCWISACCHCLGVTVRSGAGLLDFEIHDRCQRL